MVIIQEIICKLGNFERQIIRTYHHRSTRGYCAGLRRIRRIYGVPLFPFKNRILFIPK